VNANTVIDTDEELKVNGHTIGEFRNKKYGELSVADIIVHSSNRGTGRMALQIGAKRQKEFLASMGFLKATDLEIVEASTGRPQVPEKWIDVASVTISYGHGISSSPMHLAAGYAAIARRPPMPRAACCARW